MSNWSTFTLGELVSIQKGKNVETSDKMKDSYLPYLGASSLDGKINFFASKEGALLAQRSDVLMLWDGERSGLVGHNLFGVVASTVSKLTPSNLVASEFLYYLLSLNFEWIQQNRTGTGVPHVPKDISKILKLKIPDCILNQQKIAKVLSTIDNQIEQTQALIEKYTAIKQGLMSDLFSRGIDINTGKLRPSYQQAPELYWESELGWIPKGWKVVSTDEIAKEVVVGIVIKPTQYYKPHGVPVFRSANIKENEIMPSNFVYMSEADNLLNSKSILRTGDVITVRTGYPGTTCVVSAEFDGSNAIDIIITRLKESILPSFFSFWVNSEHGKGQVLDGQGGLAQQHFNVGEMKKLILPLPHIDEQFKITEVLSALGNKRQIEMDNQKKLQIQKQGLMQDLLTGKKSVDSLPDSILTPTSSSQAITQL